MPNSQLAPSAPDNRFPSNSAAMGNVNSADRHISDMKFFDLLGNNNDSLSLTPRTSTPGSASDLSNRSILPLSNTGGLEGQSDGNMRWF
jgi:hypothetical protein